MKREVRMNKTQIREIRDRAGAVVDEQGMFWHTLPGSCLSPGCRAVRGKVNNRGGGEFHYRQIKLRPFCTRCARAYRGQTSFKPGVQRVKLDRCSNQDSRLGFRCRTRHDADGSLPNYLLDVDHILAEKEGGANHPDNVQTICKTCHRTKSMESGDFANASDI